MQSRVIAFLARRQYTVSRPSAKRGLEPWEPVGSSEEAMWSTRVILVAVLGRAETPN